LVSLGNPLSALVNSPILVTPPQASLLPVHKIHVEGYKGLLTFILPPLTFPPELVQCKSRKNQLMHGLLFPSQTRVARSLENAKNASVFEQFYALAA